MQETIFVRDLAVVLLAAATAVLVGTMGSAGPEMEAASPGEEHAEPMLLPPVQVERAKKGPRGAR